MSVITRSVAFFNCDVECHYAERRYAERHYAECRYAERRYAERRYAECRGAKARAMFVSIRAVLLVVLHSMGRLLAILTIGLYHLLDGVTNTRYKLLRFLRTKIKFCKYKRALAFNRDRCCHLALCL